MPKVSFPGLTENPNKYTVIPLMSVDKLMQNRLLKLLWKLDIAYMYNGVTTR